MSQDRRRVLAVQHISAEPLGTIGDALNAANVSMQTIRVDQAEQLPTSAEPFDGVVIMGGPMGVYEAEQFPFLRDELRLLNDALRLERPILGICLGSQLLAAALGARVYPSGIKEIGWYPVTLSNETVNDPLFKEVPRTFEAFHWHGDTFELPKGAMRLASSDLTVEQGFRAGDNAWGLQFHLEVTPSVVSAMIQGADAELADARTSAKALSEGARKHGTALTSIGDTVFGRWVALLDR